jgi:hypothetical protein
MTNKYVHPPKPVKKGLFSSKPSKTSTSQYTSPLRSRFSWDEKKSRKTYGRKGKKSSACIVM